jgi:hypothetical protein
MEIGRGKPVVRIRGVYRPTYEPDTSAGSRPALGPIQPRINLVLGVVSAEVKRPRRDADHLHFTVEVKYALEQYLHSPIRLHDVLLLCVTLASAYFCQRLAQSDQPN